MIGRYLSCTGFAFTTVIPYQSSIANGRGPHEDETSGAVNHLSALRKRHSRYVGENTIVHIL